MMKIYQFFRLIRFTNLLVIGLTMGICQIFLNGGIESVKEVYFLLLVVSTLLIAAAGNIINDYFDVKADRVNKPNRLIIDKYIKRRWAMVFHWAFNSIGFIIALYVGYILQNIWMPIIAFMSVNLLWLYSAYYKRKPFVGNLLVAALIGILPIYVMLANWPIENYISTNQELIYARYSIDIIILVSIVAFCINLIREIIKDIQDVRGDLKLNARTIPIKYGIKKSKWLVFILTIGTVVVYGLFYYKVHTWGRYIHNSIRFNLSEFSLLDKLSFLSVLSASFLVFIVGVFVALLMHKSKVYKVASNVLKIAMLLGLLTPLFL
ncbi:MAG: geranylgeranylglycerol-phosphate geranylgeranyltransferase [Putridiphycobacter sp.]